MRNQHDQLIAEKHDQLITAIKNDNAIQVAALLKENPSLVNFQDLIRVRVNRNGAVAQKNYSSITPLTFAIQNGRWNSANALLAHGADPRLEGIDLGYRNVVHPVFSQAIAKVSAIQAFEGVQSRVLPSFKASFMEALKARIKEMNGLDLQMNERDKRIETEKTEQMHRDKLSLMKAKEARIEARFQEIVAKLTVNQQPYVSAAAAAPETIEPVSAVSTSNIIALMEKLTAKLQSFAGKTDEKSTDKAAVLKVTIEMLKTFETLPSSGATLEQIKDFAKKMQAIEIAREEHPLWDEASDTSATKALVEHARMMAFQHKLTPKQELSVVPAVENRSALGAIRARFFGGSSAAAASAANDKPVVGTVIKK